MVAQLCEYNKIIELYTISVNCMVCDLYLSTSVTKKRTSYTQAYRETCYEMPAGTKDHIFTTIKVT